MRWHVSSLDTKNLKQAENVRWGENVGKYGGVVRWGMNFFNEFFFRKFPKIGQHVRWGKIVVKYGGDVRWGMFFFQWLLFWKFPKFSQKVRWGKIVVKYGGDVRWGLFFFSVFFLKKNSECENPYGGAKLWESTVGRTVGREFFGPIFFKKTGETKSKRTVGV